ncbi:ATP-binding protein [Halorientalis brevis]|uniref:ATP-binding protein n=1 Tax=Halorientalis brevis TaxID=1126241 RepID=A0ABD6CEU7_9EURY|nr:hypothetical protein [Halorientalis brevis]
MSRALLAGQSGWGKSWLAQQYAEENYESHDRVVLWDYKDEYRGFIKSGFSSWVGLSDTELLSVDGWKRMLETNKSLVVARAVDDEAWREQLANFAAAARSINKSVLLLIDEAHFLAPQRFGYPDDIRGLATTGRGERVTSLWVTQRLSELDETVIAQADIRILGGFTSDSDLAKIGRTVDYNEEVHNPLVNNVTVPSEIDRNGKPVTRFVDDGGSLTGSEWIYSTTDGDRRRVNSGNLTMQSTHYSPEGNELKPLGADS